MIDSKKLLDHKNCSYIRLSRVETVDVLYRARVGEDGLLHTSWDPASEEVTDVSDERPYCGACEVYLDAPDDDWIVDD